MALYAAVGTAHGADARQAGAQAAHQALHQFGGATVALAWVMISASYQAHSVLEGVRALLGEVPLVGFSTAAELTSAGVTQRSVVVAVFGGDGVQARADWWPLEERGLANKVLQALRNALRSTGILAGMLFVVADGLSTTGEQFCLDTPPVGYSIAGCLSGGDFFQGQTFQIGGRQVQPGGLAAALVAGRLQAGVGVGEGWLPVGRFYKVTQARPLHLISLDGRPVAEVYSEVFGRSPSDWLNPPLNRLVRLYPLGLERPGRRELLVRSPLRFDPDGSLRLNATLPEGTVAHLLVGSSETCLLAARGAASAARAGLEKGRPALALALIDVAWQMLLGNQPEIEVEALRSVLGPDVPLAGGYTFGQIVRPGAMGQPQLLNQAVLVIVLGE
jgi:hypothetical protein